MFKDYILWELKRKIKRRRMQLVKRMNKVPDSSFIYIREIKAKINGLDEVLEIIKEME